MTYESRNADIKRIPERVCVYVYTCDFINGWWNRIFELHFVMQYEEAILRVE